MSRPGYAFNRQELLRAIWGDSAYRDPRAIDVHIRHLREKLELAPGGAEPDPDRPGPGLPLPRDMIRTALRGLRGRLLLALVFTSAVTLAVAAAVTLGPLQARLRDESANALQVAAEDKRPEFNTALEETGATAKATTARTIGLQARRDAASRARCCPPAFDLRERSGGARVLVADLGVHQTATARRPGSSTTPTSGLRRPARWLLAYPRAARGHRR